MITNKCLNWGHEKRPTYKMIAYKMNFVHNDRLRTVQDDIQTVKIVIQ